jgi:predicted dehydrogenase
MGANGATPPSERITIGCIGVGRMGSGHVMGCLQKEDLRVLAICDARESNRERSKQRVDQKYGGRTCATYADFRELLDRPDMDAVVIATGERWHPLIAIEAARRGKHIYCEKPMAVTVEEAKALREAVRRHNVVFQFGTQQRSSHYFRHGVELAINGRIGRLHTVAIASTGGGPYKPLPPEQIAPVPAGFDYDMWLGPAPWEPYSDLRVSLHWLNIFDYGLGHIAGSWGIHDVDIAQWVNQSQYTTPVSVEATGELYNDIRDTAHSYDIEYKYANGVRVNMTDLFTAKKRYPQFRQGGMASLFLGDKGWVYVSREGMRSFPESLVQSTIGPNENRVVFSNDHKRNFIDAIRSGEPTISPVDVAACDEMICQMGHIAVLRKRLLTWDPVREEFTDDLEANRMLSRPMRAPWRLGVPETASYRRSA